MPMVQPHEARTSRIVRARPAGSSARSVPDHRPARDRPEVVPLLGEEGVGRSRRVGDPPDIATTTAPHVTAPTMSRCIAASCLLAIPLPSTTEPVPTTPLIVTIASTA